jgi:transcriptional regulator with XRE-family HTH domain
MSTWDKLSKSKRYRAQFVSSTARRAFAFQLRAIMKKRGISQERLAEMCGLTQGVISRAADPNYGKLTVTLKAKIAGGLDMAYLGTLVPFSDAAKWISNLSEESVQIATFEEENVASSVDLSALGSSVQTLDHAKGKGNAIDIASAPLYQQNTGRLGSCMKKDEAA